MTYLILVSITADLKVQNEVDIEEDTETHPVFEDPLGIFIRICQFSCKRDLVRRSLLDELGPGNVSPIQRHLNILLGVKKLKLFPHYVSPPYYKLKPHRNYLSSVLSTFLMAD